MRNLIVTLLCVVSVLNLALAADTKATRVLILLDNLGLHSTHSRFFNEFTSLGYQVDIEMINSNAYKLKEYGEFKYDQLVILATSETDPKTLRSTAILEFYDSGRNVFIAGDVDTSKFFRLLINEFGLELDELGSKVFDHVHRASKIDHSLFGATNLAPFPGFTIPTSKSPILYRGVGMTMTKYENFQVWGLLRGNDYTYSLKINNKNEPVTISNGQEVILVGAIQGRNNARAIVTGSLDLLSNELYEASNGANQKFVRELILWNFQENGVLRAHKVYHHLQGETAVPGEYKLFDDVHYQIEVEQWNHDQSKWEPYVAKDLMYDFHMLDPYIRAPLTQKPGTPIYYVDFKVPDKYGVFQYKFIYRKPGFSFLDVRTRISVRPLKHNEYERYLVDASPYYFGVFTTMFGFFVFTVYFLLDSSKKAHHDDE